MITVPVAMSAAQGDRVVTWMTGAGDVDEAGCQERVTVAVAGGLTGQCGSPKPTAGKSVLKGITSKVKC